MKGQVWHCKEIWWKSKDVENRVSNCLVVFECFEEKDTENDIKEAVRRVCKINEKRFCEESIVVFPFSHLSSNIASLKDAQKFHEKFIERLKKEFSSVEELPFNEDKEVKIHLFGKNEDVSYFEY